MASTHRAAVKPAVPRRMASRALSPAGMGTAHSAATRMYSASPPQWSMPRRWPVTITASPGANRPDSLAATVPAASMPGTWG